MQPIAKLEQIGNAQAGERPVDSLVHSVSRRILCVFPRYTKSFGTFDNAYPLLGVKAFMPPQGLLLIAAYIPKHWEVRFIDENVQLAKERDFRWADAVLVSGMHIQRKQINDINRRAHAWGKVTVLGGPSVSGCPEYYPDFDYLHLGELGDATDALLTALAQSRERPPAQHTINHWGTIADDPISNACIQIGGDVAILFGQRAVFERMSIPLRVLRYPGTLRAESALEDTAATAD